MDRNWAGSIMQMIGELKLKEDIKDKLVELTKVAGDPDPGIRRSVKDLFIKCPSCDELLKIGRVYERIVKENRIYQGCGARTFLALSFPNSSDRSKARDFFASPRIASGTSNVFSGVFLISFEEYERGQELVDSEHFGKLIEYLDLNRSHTSFIFHVRNEMRDADCVLNELKKHVNLISMTFSHPDLAEASVYVSDRLRSSGVELDRNATAAIRKLIHEKANPELSGYDGYHSLELLADNIRYEIVAGDYGKSDGILSACEIRAISGNIDKIVCDGKESVSFGFRVG